MLYSKAASIVRNLITKSQCEQTSWMRSCNLSTKIQSIEPVATPDKLFKKIELELRGNDPAVLKSYAKFTVMAADMLGVTIGRNFTPRRPHHHRYTLLKSIHIFKKHRVQYEVRTYYQFIDMLRLTGSTADTILEYLERNLPEGVALKVTKTEILPLLESVSVPSTSISTA